MSRFTVASHARNTVTPSSDYGDHLLYPPMTLRQGVMTLSIDQRSGVCFCLGVDGESSAQSSCSILDVSFHHEGSALLVYDHDGSVDRFQYWHCFRKIAPVTYPISHLRLVLRYVPSASIRTHMSYWSVNRTVNWQVGYNPLFLSVWIWVRHYQSNASFLHPLSLTMSDFLYQYAAPVLRPRRPHHVVTHLELGSFRG